MAIQSIIKLNGIDPLTNTFYLQDVTGDYSVDNLGGYGSPNKPKAISTNNFPDNGVVGNGIDVFKIEIVRPDATVFVTDVTIESLILTYNSITNFTISDVEDLQPGEYTIKFELYNYVGQPSTTPIATLFNSSEIVYNYIDLEDIEVKINAKFASNLDFCKSFSCECNKSLLTLWSYYRALKAASYEGNTVMAAYLSAQILKILE